MMSLIPIEKEVVEQLITKRLPTPAQYATYWGRTSREQYNAAFEAFGVSFLGVFAAYFLSFAIGSFIATILGMIAGFWVLLGPEFKAYQRNWELTGGRELVDPWTDDERFDFRPEDERGLYGALYFGRISHVAVVEDQYDDEEDEYTLDEFQDYTMENDELERISGIPYQLRLRVTDDPYSDYGDSGRELQIHTRMSEEYLDLERGMPISTLLLSPSQSFESLAALTDFCVPDAGPCYVGDYPYLDRAEFEDLLVTDEELWDSLRSEGRGNWDIESLNDDYGEADESYGASNSFRNAYFTPSRTDTMKLAIISLLVASATAFAPVAKPAFGSALSAVETGAKGKPAKSAEEDLELTREIIRAAMGIDAEDAPEEKKEDEDKKKE